MDVCMRTADSMSRVIRKSELTEWYLGCGRAHWNLESPQAMCVQRWQMPPPVNDPCIRSHDVVTSRRTVCISSRHFNTKDPCLAYHRHLTVELHADWAHG